MYMLLLLLFLSLTEELKKPAENSVVQSAHLLPLVMIKTKGKFQPPTHIEHADIFKKQPAGLGIATEFKRDGCEEGEIVFFCPAKPKHKKRISHRIEMEEKLQPHSLFKKNFRKSIFSAFEELKCDKMATPIVLRNEDDSEDGKEKIFHSCGPNGVGILYDFAYELCVPLSKKEKDNADWQSFLKRQKKSPCAGYEYFKLYKFCYDHTENTTIYTEHQVISPTLYAQDEIAYDSIKIFSTMTNDYEYFKGGVFEEQALEYEKGRVINPKDEMNQTAQKLVPPKHLFFALWKQPAYHYVNVKPQNPHLSQLWTMVTDLILRNSTIMIAHDHLIYTGAFTFPKEKNEATFSDDTEEPRKKAKLVAPDIWVCMIIQFPKGETSTTKTKGLVFVMSNYLENIKARKKIEKYCEESSCQKSLKTKFAKQGGYVRCCPVTQHLSQFYGFEDLEIPEVLYIQDLNYEADTDFDKFDFDNPIL